MRRTLLLFAVFAGVAGFAPAKMPTDRELKDVKPVVNELMRPLVKGFKSGTKSASDVGDAAVALAAEAETAAAKYMLLSGAAEYFAIDKAHDKAADAVEAVFALVPDIPPDVFCKLMSKVATGVTTARLAELNRFAHSRVECARDLKAVEKKPAKERENKSLKRARAELLAGAGNWKDALAGFAELGGETAKTAKAELEGTADDAAHAEFWWNYKPVAKNAADAIRLHAAVFYKKALDAGALDGLKKVLAAKRISEAGESLLALLAKADGAGGACNPGAKYKFNYRVTEQGEIWLAYPGKFTPCVEPRPVGVLVVPDEIDGRKVVGFDDNAFINCDKMTRLVLPKHLRQFGYLTVRGCVSLEAIEIPKSNDSFATIDGALYSRDGSRLIAYPKTRKDVSLAQECVYIARTAFSSCSFVQARLPEGVAEVAQRVFDNCQNLEIVEFPKSLKRIIEPDCFGGCGKLRVIRFRGDAPQVRAYMGRTFVTFSPNDAVIEVTRGSKGWDGAGGTALPETWPLVGNDARRIEYIK